MVAPSPVLLDVEVRGGEDAKTHAALAPMRTLDLLSLFSFVLLFAFLISLPFAAKLHKDR
jgi:hypothetical protein